MIAMLKIENTLSALRAILASKLVKEYGLKKSQVAQLLGITPAAVTHYLGGSRASSTVNSISSSPEAMTFITDLAQKLVAQIKAGKQTVSESELLDASFHIVSLLSGRITGQEAVLQIPAEEKEKGPLLRILYDRLQAEQRAARMYMDIAIKLKTEPTRILFRQIATDSIRHADIITTIINMIQSGEPVSMDLPEPKKLEELLREEEGASELSLDEVKKAVNVPAIKLLIDSIDSDEEKHTRLIEGLLELVKGERHRLE